MQLTFFPSISIFHTTPIYHFSQHMVFSLVPLLSAGIPQCRNFQKPIKRTQAQGNLPHNMAPRQWPTMREATLFQWLQPNCSTTTFFFLMKAAMHCELLLALTEPLYPPTSRWSRICNVSTGKLLGKWFSCCPLKSCRVSYCAILLLPTPPPHVLEPNLCFPPSTPLYTVGRGTWISIAFRLKGKENSGGKW